LKKLIPIILLAIIITPANAQQVTGEFPLVSESFGAHTSLQNAIIITEPQTSQIFLETIRLDERHFYTFSAAKGEALNIQMFVPIIPGLEDYSPTIAFYKLGEQKEYFRYIPEMFFNEIMATPDTSGDFFVKQAIRGAIEETGIWVVEVFDEGECIVIGIPIGPSASFVEKKCTPEFHKVLQGKYGLQFGTEGRQAESENIMLTADPSTATIQGSILSFVDRQVFFEQPLGDFLELFTPGGQVETGGSPEDIFQDDLRWLALIVLLIIVILLITIKFRRK
jgi:hypothetical protein